MITTGIAPDLFALSDAIPVPGDMQLPVNAYLVRGAEPLLVDTGLGTAEEPFLAALRELIDPGDLRWIVVTHDDRDHTGSLFTLLDEAPSARVVTSFVSFAKIGEDQPLPLDRLRLMRAGDRLDIGDDALDAFRPPLFDSPGTLAFHAVRRGVCFASDCFGAFLPGAVDLSTDGDELPPADYAQGVGVFASANSPWMHDVAPRRWSATLADFRHREVDTLLSTHGLPLRHRLPGLLDAAERMPGAEVFMPPGQEFVDAVLALH